MEKNNLLSSKLMLIISQLFLFVILSAFNKPEEFIYLKEVNGIRIYYSVKAYSPKPGRSAKKIIFKLKNSTNTSKSITFKMSSQLAPEETIQKEIRQCLKANEENMSQEVPTNSTEVNSVKISEEKVIEGC